MRCRRGPRLKGDGVSRIRSLVEAEDARRRASGQPGLDLDRDCLFTLAYQGLSPDSVPHEGKAFLVKSVNDASRKYFEVRTVYNETVTDLVCDSLRRDAERAARVVGSDFLGVDVITTDPAVPLHRCGGVINEVNTTPALHHHYDSPGARYPRVALDVVQAVLRRKTAAMEPADIMHGTSGYRLAAMGDVMLAREVGRHFAAAPDDFRMDDVREVLKGFDLVCLNLENPVGTKCSPDSVQDPHVTFAPGRRRLTS